MNLDAVKPLSEQQLRLYVPAARQIILRALREVNAITGREACAMMALSGHKIGGATWRAIIHYLRLTGETPHPIVAGSAGYWLEPDEEKVREYIIGLRGRANDILTVADALDSNLRTKNRLRHEGLPFPVLSR